MKKLAYKAPAIKAANIESENLLTTSLNVNEGTTTEQWGKEYVDSPSSPSIWD
ncbi:MAG: hypothetical protein IJR71_06790 [Prevotella sp.]|nr:hypothetical protein [Prevotella sp.]